MLREMVNWEKVMYRPEPGEALDPDLAVDALRELHAAGGPPDFEHAINLFIMLDTHLLEGGKLPKGWERED